MPLPPVRYLSAGPMLPQMDTSAAMARGAAMARMGATIAAVGEKGFEIAERVRKTDEAGKISAYFAGIDRQAAEFSNSLLTRTDPERWPDDWQTMVDGFKEQASGIGLSPVARARLDLEIQDWSTQRTIRFESLSAQRAVTEAQARLDINFKAAMARGDREEAERHLSLMPGTGMMPSQIEEARMTMERGLARQGLDEEIRLDPAGTAARLEDRQTFLAENPHLTLEDRDYGLAQAKRAANERNAGAADEYQDLAASGLIRTPQDIDDHFKDRNLPPRILERMKSDIAERNSSEVRALRASPGYQASTVAKVQELLDRYTLDTEGYDAAYVEADTLVRTLPEGSAARAELSRQLRDSRAGQQNRLETAADFHRQAFADFAKQGAFGTDTAAKPLEQVLSDGLLRDTAKLEARGFSADQAASIAAETDPQAQIELFRELSKERGGWDRNTVYERAAFDAVLSGRKGYVEAEDLAAREKRRRAEGAARIKLEDWIRAHPNAGDDDGRQALIRIIREHSLPGKVDAILARPPSMDGILIDGTVLPPRPEN